MYQWVKIKKTALPDWLVNDKTYLSTVYCKGLYVVFQRYSHTEDDYGCWITNKLDINEGTSCRGTLATILGEVSCLMPCDEAYAIMEAGATA